MVAAVVQDMRQNRILVHRSFVSISLAQLTTW